MKNNSVQGLLAETLDSSDSSYCHSDKWNVRNEIKIVRSRRKRETELVVAITLTTSIRLRIDIMHLLAKFLLIVVLHYVSGLRATSAFLTPCPARGSENSNGGYKDDEGLFRFPDTFNLVSSIKVRLVSCRYVYAPSSVPSSVDRRSSKCIMRRAAPCADTDFVI